MSEPIILIPLDGSERALAALPVAKVLGDVERASLRIFHVADRRPAAGELPPTLRLEEPALDNSTIDLSVGEPAVEILLMAGKIKPRLIVMCTHTAAKRERVLGSTAMNVVRNAACPVVLVAPERGSNSVAASACSGAARWDAHDQRRSSTCGGACSTRRCRIAAGSRGGSKARAWRARLFHHAGICRSAAA